MHRSHCLPLIGPRTVALDCDIKSKINGNNHWLDDRSHQCWGELPRSQLLESPSHQPRTGTLQARLRQRTFSYSTLVWSLLSHCPYYTILLITFKSLLIAGTEPWWPILDLICSFIFFTFFFTLCSGFSQAPATIDNYNGRKGNGEYEVAKSLSHQVHTSNAWPRGRQWIAKHFFLGRTPAP